ncbi:helix-turn-helix transcriptional regulator, partial [Escherichia coli]|nr:helix-turn-helix transcriptional regulator [Escherichia coli]
MNAIEMKCRREALGLSRDALADTLDVREQNITRWEFGKNPPRDWGWIDTALTRLEDYREELVASLVAETLQVHGANGAAL